MLHRLPLCLVNSATYWQISCSNPDSNNKKEKKGKAKKTKTYLKQIHFGGQSAKEKIVDRSKEESASKVEWLEMSITNESSKSEMGDLQDGSETFFDVWFGNGDQQELEILKMLRFFVGGDQQKLSMS